MCIRKLMLLSGILVMPSLVLNAMPSARPVSRVSPAVVSEIKNALASNRPELVLQLLHNNGLSINSQLTEKNETVMHLIAQLGKLQAAEMFLAQQGGSGARKQQGVSEARNRQGMRVNVRDREGKTPLVYAQNNGHTDLAGLLQTYAQAELAALQNTAKPQDLFVAAASNDRAGAELLLAEGADPHEKKHHGRSTYSQLGFKTPFHIAFEAEHYSLAAFLLKEAQGINGLDERGWTPLMLAIVADDWDMVRELIVDGADIVAGHSENALDVAKMMESKAQLVDIFVAEKGANGVVHTYGETIPFIELALTKGHMEVSKLLLEHGAKIPTIKKSLSLSNFWTPLAIAVIDNDWDMVRELIVDGANIFAGQYQSALDVAVKTENKAKLIDIIVNEIGVDTTVNNRGNTMLTYAVTKGNTEAVKLLLDRDMNIEGKNNQGNTALNLAAREGKTEIVKLLLERGADIEARDNYGLTALMIAARDGKTKIVKLLLEHGANIESSSNNGLTALMIAARDGKTKIVEQLLDRGADTDVQNEGGHTALMYAANYGRTEIVKLLLEHGANIKAQDRGGLTVLQLESMKYKKETATLLLEYFLAEKGVDATVKRYGRNALVIAAIAGKTETVKLLLEHGADIEAQNENGLTALMWAAGEGNTETVALLLEHSANIEAKSNRGRTALMFAAIAGNTETVALLLEHEANIEVKDKYGGLTWTALMLAAKAGKTETVALLLKQGTNIEDKETYGWTALMFASRYGEAETVALLLEHGADIEAQNNSGRTALHLAAQGGKTETVALLLEHGANIEVKDKYGERTRSALQFAMSWGRTKTAQLLRKHR